MPVRLLFWSLLVPHCIRWAKMDVFAHDMDHIHNIQPFGLEPIRDCSGEAGRKGPHVPEGNKCLMNGSADRYSHMSKLREIRPGRKGPSEGVASNDAVQA